MVPDPPGRLSAAWEVEVAGGLDALPADALALFGRPGDVFSTLAWYRSLAAGVYATPGMLRIYVIRFGGAAKLVMPMAVDGPRRLRAMANFYTSLYTPLAAEPFGAPLVEALAAWARALRGERPRWHAVDLSPMDVGSPWYGGCEGALRAAGFRTQRYFCFGNWFLQLAGRSYEEYFHALPSKQRHTVLRKARHLAAMPGYRSAILSTPHQVPQAVRAFETVYARSWKQPEPYPSFIPGLLRTMAEQGWLRMGVAYLGDEPAAFQIWFVRGRTAAIYKLAYDEVHARLSIGSVLTAAMMRHAIDVDKVEEIDYLTGDEAYKRDWMSDRRERWGLAGFNRATLRGTLLGLRNVWGRRLRRLLRRQPD